MKTNCLISVFFFCAISGGLAQNHVGTWRINSATYTNARMQRESVDQSQHHELKIITPTHFMWITYEPDKVNKEKKVFGGAGGGHYTLDGIKYVESLEYASWEGYESNITDFSLRVDGDKMYQMGALSNKDGEKTIIEEEWQREKLPPQDGKHVGVWHLQSQKITGPDGKSSATDMAKHLKVKIITPTHWMFIAQTNDNGKRMFEKADGGSYTLDGDKYVERSEFENGTRTDFSLRVEGDRLLVAGTQVDAEGKKYGFDEVYQREKETPRKVASRIKQP
jgi:hypothetical protein